MNSQHLWHPLKKKPRWPNPEESIGKFYGEKQGRLCWQAQGPAREAFSLVAPAIKKHLNDCSNVVPGADWVTWSIYMIGKSKSTATPTIMFECFQKGPRKEAMDMVKKSNILNEYPGIETGHWAFPPNMIFPQQLTSGPSQQQNLSSYAFAAQGPQVTVQAFTNDSLRYRKATVGGMLRQKGKNFYFTVNHPFSSDFSVVPWPSHVVDFDDDCEFGGQSDVEDDGDGQALADATSRGSASPVSCSDRESDDETAGNEIIGSSESEDSRILPPDTGDEMNGRKPIVIHIDGKVTKRSPGESPSGSGIYDMGPTREMEADSDALTIQDIFIASTKLDYALILSANDDTTMSISDDVPVPFSKDGIPFISARNIAKTMPKDALVITLTGSSGWITGTLSGLPSYTRLPGTQEYQETFTMSLNGSLHPGDCGSCVFDTETGILYGHIIAGSTVTQSAYVLPAATVFADIASQLEQLPQSPTTLTTYSSYDFDFRQLAKHLTCLTTLPPSPTAFSEASTLTNNTTPNDLESTEYVTKVPRNPVLKGRTPPPYQPIRKTTSYAQPKGKGDRVYERGRTARKSRSKPDHINPALRPLSPPLAPPSPTPTELDSPLASGTAFRESKSLVEPDPTFEWRTFRLSNNSLTDETPLPASEYQDSERALEKRRARNLDNVSSTATVSSSLPTSRSKKERNVGFLHDPVTSVSRPINIEESWAAHHFEIHAQKCAYCHNPYEVHRSHEQLCEIGHRLAQDVAALMYRGADGTTYSTVEEDGGLIRLEVPSGYVHVKGLLKAIERSVRHRNRQPFVSMDR